MRPQERMDLLERIGRELQGRWTYQNVRGYLRRWKVDVERPTSDGGMSKYVYVKDLLEDEDDSKLLDIADDLSIQHDVVRNRPEELPESSAWRPNHFRVFLSHISAFKRRTAQIQILLKAYGISAFVAHEDIEPTAEWQEEILKALFSMDALVALLTPGFKESNWTDQEVGVAIGRDVLIIPIRRELDPYGFISKYQAFQGLGQTVGDVAEAVFEILAKHQKSRGKLFRCLVDLFLVASTPDDANRWLELMKRCENPPQPETERLRVGAQEKSLVLDSSELTDGVNAFLQSRGLEPLSATESGVITDDDIPF